jgi:phosphoribosylamine---glycine ligase
LICAPGNPGIANLGRCVAVSDGDTPALSDLAAIEQVDLVVVGPEAPLVDGIADAMRARGIKVFGPSAACARIEGSKSHAKRLMEAKGIPTARAAVFDRLDDALTYIRRPGRPVVVKADGLAAGKGVTVCDDARQAETAIREAMTQQRFGDAGARVVIEERLDGEEISVLAFCDGKTVLAMQAAQDFKRAHDGDTGPNTGGMGSYSPVPTCTPEVMGRVIDEILEPIAAAVAEDAEPYVGVIYAGLMLTSGGPKVIEFNCRFGDPETQALLPRLRSDLAEVALACVEGTLAGVELEWRDEACVAVAAASEGYPNKPATGRVVTGIEKAEKVSGLQVFQAGTAFGPGGEIVTSGGRVLAACGLGRDHAAARKLAYSAMREISFEGMWYRSDIAARVFA